MLYEWYSDWWSPNFFASIPSKTMHAIQIVNPFDATHQIIIALRITGITGYFNVRKSTQEEYEDQNELKIELMVEAPPWDSWSLELSKQEQSMFDYRGQFVSPNTPMGKNIYQLCHIKCS